MFLIPQKRRYDWKISPFWAYHTIARMGRRPPHTATGKYAPYVHVIFVLFFGWHVPSIFPSLPLFFSPSTPLSLPPPPPPHTHSLTHAHTPHKHTHSPLTHSPPHTHPFAVVARTGRAFVTTGSKRTRTYSGKTFRGTYVCTSLTSAISRKIKAFGLPQLYFFLPSFFFFSLFFSVHFYYLFFSGIVVGWMYRFIFTYVRTSKFVEYSIRRNGVTYGDCTFADMGINDIEIK